MKKFFAGALVAMSMTAAASAQVDADVTKRIEASHAVLHELMATPDKGIPLNIAAKATCVVVIPAFKKAAFLLGGQYGQGLATCRTGHGWSAPIFVQMSGASFGFQVGGQSTDLVMIGLNHQSLQDLLKDHVKLGGNIAVAAGPVGRNSTASTDVLAKTEFLAYSRSRGLFAGVDVSGDEIHQNSKDTENVYGKDIKPETILSGSVKTPPAAAHFISTVNQLFKAGLAQ